MEINDFYKEVSDREGGKQGVAYPQVREVSSKTLDLVQEVTGIDIKAKIEEAKISPAY